MSVNPVVQSTLSYVGLTQEAQRLRQLAAMLDQTAVRAEPVPAPPAATPRPEDIGRHVDILV